MTKTPNNRKDGVSSELDELSSTLMGDALDLLAEGEEVDVLLVVEDVHGSVASYAFSEDGPQACLDAARDRVRHLKRYRGDQDVRLAEPVRYALAYEGAIADETGAYRDALLLEFGECGYKSYSAYALFKGKGQGDGFVWSDPAPAGELECLL